MRNYLLILLGFGLCLNLSCKKETEEQPSDTFDEVIEKAGGFENVVVEETVVEEATTEKTEDGQRWRCTTKTVEAKNAAGGNDGFPLFNPNANVIYPGSMLQGATLRKATPDVIAVGRAGGTISYDIIDGNKQSTFSVNEVSKSSITDGMNQIIGGASGVVPANFSFNYTNIQSRQQFALEVEADYENAFLELEGYLSISTDKSFNSYLVRLNQSYYTMSFDIPTDKDQLFASNVSPQELSKYVRPGNPATYVSDVTYGRIYYMLIESTSSVFDMEAGISGSFSAIASSGGGSVDASYLRTLSNLKIQVFAYGGEASATLRTVVDASTLDSLVNKLASAGDIRSGKPISYVVRSVYDNRVVSVQLANKYDVTNCEPLGSGNTPPALTSHWANLVQDFGAVGAAVNFRNNKIGLFNKAGNRFMLSEGNILSGPYDIADIADGQLAISAIGSGGFVSGTASTSGCCDVFVFDMNGNRYQVLQGASNSNPTLKTIGSLWGGGCPFNAQGITGFAYIDLGSANGAGQQMVINKNGDEVAFYDLSERSWDATASTIPSSPLIVSGNQCPFNSLGAVCYLPEGSSKYTIFFNKQGTQYCLWEETNGFSPAYDL